VCQTWDAGSQPGPYLRVRGFRNVPDGETDVALTGRRHSWSARPMPDLFSETIAAVRPVSAEARAAARERLDRMTKPRGALGRVEELAVALAGIARACPPPLPEPAAVAVFAGDHGVHAQGVTPWPQEVTAQMVANFLAGGAVVNAFARQVGAGVTVVDVGVRTPLDAHPDLRQRRVAAGTADMTTGPAMTRDEARRAVEVGIEVATELVGEGSPFQQDDAGEPGRARSAGSQAPASSRCLITGDMGIANTTPAAALICAFTGADPADVTGRGTGIDDATLARKTDVVRRALALHAPDPADPLGVVAAVGGLEHAALAGFVLGGAAAGVPVLLDGVNAGAAALVAAALAPDSVGYCLAGHVSAEPGHRRALAALGITPLLDLEMRLGEGTGALLALPVVAGAARALQDVATFDAAGVVDKTGG
jgi:nicotinate-nucleotide--dimethylbenzimidazole phosphoribosyltransferase